MGKNSKLINFSNEEKLAILNAILVDEKEASGENESKTIENILMNHFLTYNDVAGSWIIKIHMGKEKTRDILGQIFQYFSMHIEEEQKALKYVEFAFMNCMKSAIIDEEAARDIMLEFWECVSLLKRHLKISYDVQSDLSIVKEIENELRSLDAIELDVEEDDDIPEERKLPKDIDKTLNNLYISIISSWTYINMYSNTYELLSLMVKLQESDDSAVARVTLSNAIRNIEKWP